MWIMTNDRRQKFAEEVLLKFYQGRIKRWTAFNYLVEAGYGMDKAKRVLDKAQELNRRMSQEENK